MSDIFTHRYVSLPLAWFCHRFRCPTGLLNPRHSRQTPGGRKMTTWRPRLKQHPARQLFGSTRRRALGAFEPKRAAPREWRGGSGGRLGGKRGECRGVGGGAAAFPGRRSAGSGSPRALLLSDRCSLELEGPAGPGAMRAGPRERRRRRGGRVSEFTRRAPDLTPGMWQNGPRLGRGLGESGALDTRSWGGSTLLAASSAPQCGTSRSGGRGQAPELP